MIKYIILIIIGFIALIKGADLFVDGISSTAINLKISKIIISLTIVAFGTSSPELAISIQGLANGNGNLVLSNVVGSTIVNTMLVLGIASIIKPIRVKSETVKKQMPLHLIIIVVFSILFLDSIFDGTPNVISRSDGIILFLLFIIFIIYIIDFTKKSSSITTQNDPPKWKTSKSIIYSLIGLLLIFVGSELAVNNCTHLASAIGISDKLITMTILVIGTSSPELAMAINSAKKKEFDIIIGNIIGTNIFNIGFVLGLPIIIFGGINAIEFSIVDMFLMIISGIFIYLFSRDDKVISKSEGIAMIIIWITYYTYVILTGL